MQTKKHIFEIKQEIAQQGWSHITPDQFDELDFFTKQFIMEVIDDSANFEPTFHDIVLGNGHIYWVDTEIEGEW